MRRLIPTLALFFVIFHLVPSVSGGVPEDEASLLLMEADALRENAKTGKDLQLAVQKYEQALRIFERLSDKQAIGVAANNLGLVHAHLSQHRKAVEYFEKSLTAKRDREDRKGEGSTLNNLGAVYEQWGQYDKAAEYYEKSLTIKRDYQDREQEGRTLGNLGIVYWHWGQYAKAVEYFEKSLAIAQQFSDRQPEANALNNLGVIYNDWGRYASAVECYEKSLGIKRELGDRMTEGGTLENLGTLYGDLGQYERAIEYYEKSLAMFRELKLRNEEGGALGNIGNILAHRGDRSQALARFEEQIRILSEVGANTGRPKNCIANLHLDSGDLVKAEQYLKGVGYDASLGRLALMKSDYVAAASHYKRRLKLAEKNRDAETLFTSLTGLGLAHEGMGEDTKAEDYFRKAVVCTEELRSNVTASEREGFLEARAWGFYRTAAYEGLARILVKMNRPVEGLKTSEHAKARMFAESISRQGQGKNHDLPPDVLKKHEELAGRFGAARKNLQNALEKGQTDAARNFQRELTSVEEQLRAHKKMLREKYPVYAASKYPEPMDLSQTALKNDEWVLSYDVGDPGLIVYLTKGKELKKALFKAIPRKDLDALVRKFRVPLDIKSGERIDEKIVKFDFAAGKKLTDLLLGDILPELLKDAPLIVIPADCLGVLPFEMLVLNDGGKIAHDKRRVYTTGAQFFGDRNPISYYQSITALTLARNFGKGKGSQTKRLVMSDPIFDVQDQRLKDFGAQKKEALIKALPQQLMAVKQENRLEFPRLALTGDLGKTLHKMDPDHTELCAGMDASKSNLFKKPLDKYNSLIFATHGYFGKDLAAIQEPVLVLTQVDQPQGQDGFLRLSEVMGLKLNADIVALTACQTGLGRQISGEGTMGMGRAFQYAGARSVLMSLWNVDERASVKLVESFFRNLKEGKSKLEALRLARNEIRKDGYDHPFYWAPFILVGEVQ